MEIALFFNTKRGFRALNYALNPPYNTTGCVDNEGTPTPTERKSIILYTTRIILFLPELSVLDSLNQGKKDSCFSLYISILPVRHFKFLSKYNLTYLCLVV